MESISSVLALLCASEWIASHKYPGPYFALKNGFHLLSMLPFFVLENVLHLVSKYPGCSFLLRKWMGVQVREDYERQEALQIGRPTNRCG